MNYPWIMQLNRTEPTVKFCALPHYLQQFIKCLWEQGIIIEVYGEKSRTWQPIHQRSALWEGNKYYRLKGDVHYACQKVGRTHKEAERGVYVSDPVALPENSICYMADGYALSATVTPY